MHAHEVSVARRVAQISASVFFSFTVAGVVFGFAALKPILQDSGVYSHLCAAGEKTCKEQDTRLNLLFIAASSANNVAALPMGMFLDYAGPRAASILGGLLFGSGCLTFSLGIVRPYLDTGYIMLALGAPATFLSQFHLSNAFPERSGLILGTLTGAFDASPLPLCLYKIAYFALGRKPTVKTFFLTYSIIPVLLIIQQLMFGAPTSYSRPAPTSDPEPESNSSSRPDHRPLQNKPRRVSSSFSRVAYNVHDDADDEQIKGLLEKQAEGSIVGVLFGKGVWEQVRTSWWLAMEFMVMVHMTRINWYLTTVNTQLLYYTGNPGLTETLTNAFIFLLPIGGLVSIPFIGYLVDNRPTLDVIFVMGILGAMFGVVSMLPGTVPQLIGISAIVMFRPFFYTAISDYAAKVFGFQTFGTVYGLGMTLSGLFGLILTPLDILTKGPLHGSYTPINITLLILGIISSSVLAYRVWSYTRQGRIQLEESGLRGEVIVEEDD